MLFTPILATPRDGARMKIDPNATEKQALRTYVSPALLAFGHFRDLTMTTPGRGGRADGGTGANTKQNAGQ